jgi:hypothetical protein
VHLELQTALPIFEIFEMALKGSSGVRGKMIHEKAEVWNLVNCPFNGIRRMYKKKKKRQKMH